MTKRLFFALWPDLQARSQCQALIAKLPVNAGKPTAAANLHVTLCFLGTVTADQQIALEHAALQLPAPNINLVFDTLSYWKKPEVLCLTASQFTKDIVELAGKLAEFAKEVQIETDARPYQPHVTLLRKAKAKPSLVFAPLNWIAASFCLVESCAVPEGVVYRVIRIFGRN